jgi:hypothetical protein
MICYFACPSPNSASGTLEPFRSTYLGHAAALLWHSASRNFFDMWNQISSQPNFQLFHPACIAHASAKSFFVSATVFHRL